MFYLINYLYKNDEIIINNMKKQNSDKNITKLGDYLKCNFFKSNNRVNNRYKSINAYKNIKSELLIRKRKRKNTTQNIFELINFQELLLNHYKNFELYYNKSKENKGRGEIIKYIKYDDIVLGKGAFGKCYQFRAIDKEDMNFYAGKIIKKEEVSNHKNSLLDEINIQRKFKDNPKIVKVKDYFEDDENVYIILELCKNKSLADYLCKRGGKLSEIEVKCYIFQLLQGLKCLHKNKIIHRDLKPNNLLLDDKNELKIGDFGEVAHLTNDKDRRHTICGTYNYMAPEIFENNGKGYSFEVDIWSVGIIMYQLLTGKLPFDGESIDEIKKNILKFKPEDLNVSGLSIIAADLIKQILIKNPKNRPAINQIIYHYFFHDTEFPKYITQEFLSKIDRKEKQNNKEEEKEKEKEKKLKMELYNLIVDDIDKIEYENIKNYVIKESATSYKQYITYCHESSHYGFYYFEFNNEIIGMISKDKDGNIPINMIYNTQTKIFYIIEVDRNNMDDDIIRGYTREEIPDKIKSKTELFLEYYILLLKKKKNIEVEYESSSINGQNSFSKRIKIEQNSFSNESSIISQNRVLDKSNLIYVRSIIAHKGVTILSLSDQTIEAIFRDNIKILISGIKDKIEIINKDNKINAVSANNAFQNSNKDFAERLKFVKSVIFKDIKNKWSKNIKEKNQN